MQQVHLEDISIVINLMIQIFTAASLFLFFNHPVEAVRLLEES